MQTNFQQSVKCVSLSVLRDGRSPLECTEYQYWLARRPTFHVEVIDRALTVKM